MASSSARKSSKNRHQAKLDGEHLYEIKTPLRLGRFAPFQWEHKASHTRVRIFWKRSIIWGLGLLASGWVLTAAALYYFVIHERGYTDVRFSQMLQLPWKLDEYRRSKAEFNLREGIAAAEAQRWMEAYYLLRAGLPMAPDHRDARLLLARIYLMAGRPDHARTTLQEGLPHHGDQVDYLRTVLSFLFGQQADEAVIAMTEELRARPGGGPELSRLATTALAFAYFNRDRYAEAEQVFAEGGLNQTPEARFIAARVTWERGRRAEAIARLRELNQQVPEDLEIYRTLLHYLHEDGRPSEARRVAITRELAFPERPEAYLDHLSATVKLGDLAEAAQIENDYLERFAGALPAKVQLAQRAAQLARPDTVARVLADCQAAGATETEIVTLLQAEAWLEAGQPTRVAAMSAPAEGWRETTRLTLDGLRAVALYQLGQALEADPAIGRIVETRRLPAETLLSLANRLNAAGQRESAHRLLVRAVETDPLSQPALVARLRDALKRGEIGERGDLIARLADMRKPPEDLLTELHAELESDRHLFTKGREQTARVLSERISRIRSARG